jgi:hypothetical protein
MILNHKAAIELLVEQATEIGFNRYTILNLHALLSDNLLADSQACGRLRVRSVGICVFQMKAATDSRRKLPLVPRESCHPFQSKSATL